MRDGRYQPRMRDGRMIRDGQTKVFSATTEIMKDQPKMKAKKINQFKSEKDHPKRSFRLER
jgi:hypothetical protein